MSNSVTVVNEYRTATKEGLGFDGLLRWEPATRTITLSQEGSPTEVISFGSGDGVEAFATFLLFRGRFSRLFRQKLNYCKIYAL
jgi:hypothetical protein